MSDVVTVPPLGLRLLYHTLGWRLGDPYREWVAADLADERWFHRHWCIFAPFLVLVGTLLYGTRWLVTGRFDAVGYVVVVVVAALFPRVDPDRLHQVAAARQQLPGTSPNWWARQPNGVVVGVQGAVLVAGGIFIANIGR